jgi:hypothetical protein
MELNPSAGTGKSRSDEMTRDRWIALGALYGLRLYPVLERLEEECDKTPEFRSLVNFYRRHPGASPERAVAFLDGEDARLRQLKPSDEQPRRPIPEEWTDELKRLQIQDRPRWKVALENIAPRVLMYLWRAKQFALSPAPDYISAFHKLTADGLEIGRIAELVAELPPFEDGPGSLPRFARCLVQLNRAFKKNPKCQVETIRAFPQLFFTFAPVEPIAWLATAIN